MADHHRPAVKKLCAIAGCSDEGVARRQVVIEYYGTREIDVCRKHETGDIDPTTVEVAAG